MLRKGAQVTKEGAKKVIKEGATALKNKALSLVGRVAEYYARKTINKLIDGLDKKLTYNE